MHICLFDLYHQKLTYSNGEACQMEFFSCVRQYDAFIPPPASTIIELPRVERPIEIIIIYIRQNPRMPELFITIFSSNTARINTEITTQLQTYTS